jgi:hypothetical protein
MLTAAFTTSLWYITTDFEVEMGTVMEGTAILAMFKAQFAVSFTENQRTLR